jgi:Immunoglobulin I-set domain
MTSTTDETKGVPFRVKAIAVDRESAERDFLTPHFGEPTELSETGRVVIADQVVRLVRPGVTEEYSVSMDGVRQDFIVAERPPGEGKLCVTLAVDGATAGQSPQAAHLLLSEDGRKIAYHRLQVFDAAGKALAAVLRVRPENQLTVEVEDSTAVYPVRIDPTFTDANWLGMGYNLDERVLAIATTNNATYVGGVFSTAGGMTANYVAKWDGGVWSPLGSGMNTFGYVRAMAISGSNLYAAGQFTSAGGVPAGQVAKWDGNSWMPLGTNLVGFSSFAKAMAVLGNDLYVGGVGVFATTGGVQANNIVKWDGTNWSPLGSGMNSEVNALVVMNGRLYAGGSFTTAGGVAANCIARWDGTNWSALGAGLNNSAYALTASGNTLYAGGNFTMAGGSGAGYVARWDGTNWHALAGGVNNQVYSLAAEGNDLYAGGKFSMAGGAAAPFIARWDGSAWSSLGTGVDWDVLALVVSEPYLYVGGRFITAGGKPSAYLARAILPSAALQITDQPDSLSVAVGNQASFSVTATGTPPLSYQWRKNGTNLANGGNISGVTTTNLTLTNVQTNNAGNYTVVVTNAYGSVTSVVAMLTVTNPPPPGVVPGLYLTNAVVLPNGFAQFEVRAPSSNAYTLVYSFDLRTWNFWTVLSGTNRYILQTPGPISDLGTVFLRLAPLGQAQYNFAFRFRNSWNGPLASGTPSLSWPQAFQNWQATLDVVNSTNLPPSGVSLSGPAGSGIVNAPTEFNEDDTYAGSYDSDLFPLPPAPPGGAWSVAYGSGSLSLSEPDPQLASRSVMVVPSFSITNGQLHGVSWTYRNMTTGAPLGARPNFISRVAFDFYGPDFTECGEYDSGVLFREFSSAGTTNFTISPPLLWSNVLLQIEYKDTLDNTYTLNYSFGNLYEVYGANSFSAIDYCDPVNSGFTRLGSATNTATFPGAYVYYLVRVPKHNVVKVDTTRGSNGSYFGTTYTGNVTDYLKIGGVPDNQYAVVGPTPRGTFTGGFFVINAAGLGLTGITVYVLP